MRTKWTWEVVDLPSDEICAVIASWTTDELINFKSDKNAELDLIHCYGPDRYSNASLCAAAPDLATAIDLILRKGLTKETRNKARKALKNARSEHVPNVEVSGVPLLARPA